MRSELPLWAIRGMGLALGVALVYGLVLVGIAAARVFLLVFIAVLLASESDVDDLVPTLVAFQIEWNKIRVRMLGARVERADRAFFAGRIAEAHALNQVGSRRHRQHRVQHVSLETDDEALAVLGDGMCGCRRHLQREPCERAQRLDPAGDVRGSDVAEHE